MKDIGEPINVMFVNITEAISNKDKKHIQEMAAKQLEAGANVLDINVGTKVAKEARKEVMIWLVDTVREVTNNPLAIDNPSIATIRAGVEAACKKAKL